MKVSKCECNAKRIEFVGFMVTSEGVEMEPDHITTVTKWLMPASYCNIRVFLGFANFYFQFIKNVSKIAMPISNMLKGGKNGQFP